MQSILSGLYALSAGWTAVHVLSSADYLQSIVYGLQMYIVHCKMDCEFPPFFPAILDTRLGRQGQRFGCEAYTAGLLGLFVGMARPGRTVGGFKS